MNTKQLWQALSENSETDKYFDGVFPRDALKEIKQKPKLIICNTDPSDKPGEHWVLFFFDDENNVEFFDSLGKRMDYYNSDLINFASKFAIYHKWCTKRIQPVNSDLCGHYCLYYAHKRCKGENMESIITSMKSPTSVLKYVKKYFKICKSNSCIFQCCNKL